MLARCGESGSKAGGPALRAGEQRQHSSSGSAGLQRGSRSVIRQRDKVVITVQC